MTDFVLIYGFEGMGSLLTAPFNTLDLILHPVVKHRKCNSTNKRPTDHIHKQPFSYCSYCSYCVLDCKSYKCRESAKSIFHHFPSDQQLTRQWIVKI